MRFLLWHKHLMGHFHRTGCMKRMLMTQPQTFRVFLPALPLLLLNERLPFPRAFRLRPVPLQCVCFRLLQPLHYKRTAFLRHCFCLQRLICHILHAVIRALLEHLVINQPQRLWQQYFIISSLPHQIAQVLISCQ